MQTAALVCNEASPNPNTNTKDICTEPELGTGLAKCAAGLMPLLAPGNVTISTVFKGGIGGCVMYRTPSYAWVTTKNGTLLTQTLQIPTIARTQGKG